MKFLPEHVPDVNAAPPSTEDRNVLDVLITSDDGAGLWDCARIVGVISRRHNVGAVKGKRVGLIGYKGYIGRHLREILLRLGFKVELLGPGNCCNEIDYIINLACPRKTIKIKKQVCYLEDSYTKFMGSFRSGYILGEAQQQKFNVPPERCLYFSSQSIFDSPSSSVYSQCKQIATDEYTRWGWKVFAPGTVFGSFMNLLRTDTVINRLLGDPVNPDNYITKARRSFISIYEVVEAVVAFLCGEDIAPWQSWNIGRAYLDEIVPETIADWTLCGDTGTSLKNFYPKMSRGRIIIYREYMKLFADNHNCNKLEIV